MKTNTSARQLPQSLDINHLNVIHQSDTVLYDGATIMTLCGVTATIGAGAEPWDENDKRPSVQCPVCAAIRITDAHQPEPKVQGVLW
jgi:hypothetical protein